MLPLRGGWETTLACFHFLGASSLWTRTQNLVPVFASKRRTGWIQDRVSFHYTLFHPF